MQRTARRCCFELLEKRVVLDGAEARPLFDSSEFIEGNYALKLDSRDYLYSEDGEPVVVGGQHVTKNINGFSIVGANFKDDSFQLLLKKGSRNYALNSSKELFFSDFFHSIDFEESILLDEDYRFSSMGSRKENLLGLFSSNSNEIYVQRNENKSFTELYSLSLFREMGNGDFYGINIEPVRYWSGRFVTASLMNPAVYEIVVEDSVLSFQESVNIDTKASVYEYAFQVAPGWDAVEDVIWIGNAHGFDMTEELTLVVDGKEEQLHVNEIRACQNVKVNRVSYLFHPSYEGMTDPICKSSVTYSFSTTSLSVSIELNWLVDAVISTAYSHMYPAAELFHLGNNVGLVGNPIDLTENDGTNGEFQSDFAYAWNMEHRYAMALNIFDVNNSLNNYVNTDDGLWIQDRTNGSLNKIYATRVSGSDFEIVGKGDNWLLQAEYLFDSFDVKAEPVLFSSGVKSISNDDLLSAE